MKTFIRKVVATVMSALLLCGFSASANASENYDNETAEAAAPATILAKSGVLMEQSTGRILASQNPQEKLPLASITKIMTMLLVMEAIDQGSIQLAQSVTASAHACSMGGSQIWLKEGEIMTVDELLRATAIASANDAAMALAELVGGSEEGFVAMMNNKAAELSMLNTTFVNPTGLDATGHLSTAEDIAIMSRALLSHEKTTEYTTVWMDTLRGGKTELVNTNKLVKLYKGCNGLKTGTTSNAGSCISVSATRDGMGLISVVMGSATSKDRFDSARALLDYGFSTFTLYKAEVTPELLPPILVTGGIAGTVPLKCPESRSIVLEKGRVKLVTREVVLTQKLAAPVKAGQQAGEAVFTAEGKELLRIPILTALQVEKMTLSRAFFEILTKVLKM